MEFLKIHLNEDDGQGLLEISKVHTDRVLCSDQLS